VRFVLISEVAHYR